MTGPLVHSAAAPLLLAADLHVLPGGKSEARFREFLEWLATTRYDVAFLGDVMELWIGLPAYECALHREFLEWCRAEKQRRRVYLLEGNHEYFVARHHGDCFTAADGEELEVNGLELRHGDVCAATPQHLRFRWWVKSALAHLLLHFPGAAAYVRHLKRSLEEKARRRVWRFPQAELSRWATAELEAQPRLAGLVLGHFHQQYWEPRRDGRFFAVLPAWKDHGEVAVWDAQTLAIRHWRNL